MTSAMSCSVALTISPWGFNARCRQPIDELLHGLPVDGLNIIFY
jgi:hypothetical protein